MAGEPEKILRASFCGAANHLTQLYMVSLKQEKMAYKRGYCQGIEAVIRSLQQLQQGRSSATVSVDTLIELLNSKKREVANSVEDATADAGEEEEEENKDTHPQSTHSFSTQTQTQQFGQPIASPFQQTNQLSTTSFGQPSSSQISQPQFSFGAPPPSQSTPLAQFPSVSSATASTFTQAVSNSIPFPLPFQTQHGLGQNTLPLRNVNSSRKRQFFEFLFDATPAQGNIASSAGYTNGFFNGNSNTTTSTTTTTSTAGNATENGDMDFSAYPSQATWKRSRFDEPLTIQNNG